MTRPKDPSIADKSTLDAENPVPSVPLPYNGPPARFATPQHAKAGTFLYNASRTGKLGSGPAERDISSSSYILIILRTIPWPILTIQLLWSLAIIGIGYLLRTDKDAAGNEISSLSVVFWTSKLNVSSTIAYGVGWALFVLLGFFVREANNRYKEAQESIESTISRARQMFRLMRQMFPEGFFHPGDTDRIAAHFVAFPIALKMTLRGERERSQLEHILHPDDVTDVLETDVMFTQCTRVLRGYLSAAEDDATISFQHCAAEKTTEAWGVRYVLLFLIDAMDGYANTALRIAHFSPSAGYMNHLQIFLYIWIMFLPLVLIQSSGWFTVLWSVIITYCVGMLFHIADALNQPFGFDLQDIKLNRICSEWAYEILLEHSMWTYSMKETVRHDHDTPEWVEKPIEQNKHDLKKRSMLQRKMRFAYRGIGRNLGTSFMIVSLSLFITWLAFIIFLTWALARDSVTPREESDRWWSLYLPLNTDTTGFMSLGVFLILGFWMNDAYGRYWNSMQIWNTAVKPGLEGCAFILGVLHKEGFWHKRDRTRFFSFFVAYVYAIKQHLRQSRDVSELEDILDPQDLQALSQAPNLPSHCLNILYGYINSSDCMEPGVVDSNEREYGWSNYNITFKLWAVENAVTALDATRKYPMSPSFTAHLCIYVFFWFALLPISLVKENGFVTFAFIIPVAYAIINLISIGNNLSDPFGFDAEDIPMEKICAEVKNSMHKIYVNSKAGLEGYIHEEPYDRSVFTPESVTTASVSSDEEDDVDQEKAKNLSTKAKPEEESEFTLKDLLKNVADQLPSVSIVAQLSATLWSVIAVLVSWRLSKLDKDWENGVRGGCHEWCSPIDVDGDTLANIGYALFMLLSFRASDAIGRYEDGAELVYDLKLQLHSSLVDSLHTFKQDYIHPNDRERFVAHLVQVPLLIRDRLLQGESFNPVSEDTLLSKNDQRRLAESYDPIEHVLHTLESYGLLIDKPNRKPFTSEPFEPYLSPVYYVIDRCLTIRELYAKMLSVKMFPVISRYANHQYVFTGLWLGLLPLYMTRTSGFFTILWAPLISYGVFALQSIAEKLVDPYGEDSIDIPIRKLLTETAEEILNTSDSLGWDSYRHTRPSPIDDRPSLGAVLSGGTVGTRRQLAYFEEHEATVENFGKSPLIEFNSTGFRKPKPNLLVHLVNSVPWWSLTAIVAWTAVGCVISYVTRDTKVTNVRWWKSGISVGTNVATYVSFAAFMLLGFYVQAAFRRYTQAGTVWGDSLRASCHAFSALMMELSKNGTVHENDHDRINGHIAAIPLVLKHELRHSRDLRELKGLLSQADIGRIQSAKSMTTHCVDVLRAYMQEYLQHRDRLVLEAEPWGSRPTILTTEVGALQTALRSARFLNEFDLAPGFITLLNSLLAIWFLLLPFVLAEISGWFTILWVGLIAYGVLGMYAVAAELQSPFGLDVNDLDLDKIADFIVRDILFVQKNYKSGLKTLTRPSDTVDLWKPGTVAKKHRQSFYLQKEQPILQRLKEKLVLAAQTVAPLQMLFIIAWAGASVAFAYGTSKWFKLEEGVCTSMWFCSYIAVAGSLKGFIGFALFLLLGTRLYDSHARYVMGVRLWQEKMLGLSRLLATRFLTAYPPGSFHEGDLERICGHIAAFAICAMGALRGEDYEEKLGEVVSREDVERILSARERIDYCMDVVRAYLQEGNWRRVRNPDSEPAGSHETSVLLFIVRDLAQSAYECRRLVRIPLPFGYIQHLKIFLHIWLLLLPLGLFEATGWITILWVTFIAYGVLGVEHWSEELADPFGHDVSDVPLDEMCDRIIADVKEEFDKVAGKGVALWVHPERKCFEGANAVET